MFPIDLNLFFLVRAGVNECACVLAYATATAATAAAADVGC